jgi:Outer membrane protein beta-barrel domain
MKTILAAASLLLASTLAAANERPFKFVLGAGLTGGGSTLANVTYTNGDTQTIKAGGLLMLYGGLETRIGDLVRLQATFGYHIDDTNASNGRVRFSRYPIDLLALYPVSDKVRLGAGAQFVNNPKLKGSGVASGVNQEYDSTVGFIFEGEYLFTPAMGLKLRGVSEKYKESNTGVRVNGNHVGLLFSVYF